MQTHLRTRQCGPAYTSWHDGKAAFSTRDVSILIPTINTPNDFTVCMRLWLANAPREIIIVTIPRDLQRVNELLAAVEHDQSVPIHVLTVPKPGRREQMSLAIRHATGKIIAYVDDDTYWPSNQVLPHLLAGFENPRVGGVGGKQSAFVPTERRKPGIVTASEVASVRALAGSAASNADLYAREGVVWCLTGRTLLARAAALQTPEFCHALTHDTWAGKKINTGDDGFITHYLMNRGWRLAFQSAPEAEVLTLVEPAENFIKQLVRWRRSGYRTYYALALHEPGFRTFYAWYPYFGRLVARFLVRPLTTVVHSLVWLHAFWAHPKFAAALFAYQLHLSASEALSFYRQNPWIGYRNIWAIMVMDNLYQLINVYVCLTLGVEGWLTRDDSQKGCADDEMHELDASLQDEER
ncbi:nucleotide-diphospho-sugar transferase [Microdochium trichocladiopsis]|uniref:Nucleotide-diphospho-sugar transferase n=1 Tax=Microdochium trichocladiopsis TaxID=1682393 RepID=A0A9P8XRW3_9PEZI|nr:nucleotide-diphospho-sugar transferase [Microdochium trichocladiopsis]KAH7014273.1 nucleotide-diphospho-sugar transferase [Microdochium trichocladiopsis]